MKFWFHNDLYFVCSSLLEVSFFMLTFEKLQAFPVNPHLTWLILNRHLESVRNSKNTDQS